MERASRRGTVRLLSLLLLASAASAQPVVLHSPDGSIEARLETAPALVLEIWVDGMEVARAERIALDTQERGRLGVREVVRSQQLRSHDKVEEPVVANKNSRIVDRYNESLVTFRSGFSLRLRAYDNGIAYRFETKFSGDLIVLDESLVLRFPGSETLWFAEEESFYSHNERDFLRLAPDSLVAGRFASLPLLAGRSAGPKVLFSEANLRDYPGLWLRADSDRGLRGVFAHVPRRERLRGDRDLLVEEREPFIARTRGERSFPWRLFGIAREDRDLLGNELTFLLADPNELEEPSWIRPGKVAWDWYNYNNLTGVGFRAGVNTDTYRHYIDFAAENGIEYVILDEGWYRLGDVLDVSPDIDLPALLSHAESRGVGLILWVVWTTLNDRLDEALAKFEEWGVKGIKVDFMQRDDQPVVNWYWDVSRKAAAHHLLVDFHGAYKPDGMRRTLPNVISREGVMGLEHNKWAATVTPRHNVTLPFTRMALGPMDYTPGAVRNANPVDFRAVFNRPMSQGTRSHQVAMYVVYESPLQMLADTPSNYRKEGQTLSFIAGMPTTWDETVPLAGAVGEFVAVARRKGEVWYIGAMTNESPREVRLSTGFLESDREYDVDIHRDGPNADRHGEDFVRETVKVKGGGDLLIRMAAGGGWAAVVRAR